MKKLFIRFGLMSGFFLFISQSIAFASEGNGSIDITEHVNLLVFQISAIIFASFAGASLFNRLRLPPVLGEIIAGVIIGPYALGKLILPGFEHGLFPIAAGFPVSIELYSLAAIASIVLLFLVGLETDIDLFIRFSVAGSVVGVFGVLVSFVMGDLLGVFMSYHLLEAPLGFFHPLPLFLGVMSTATSVGITARILSEKKKMNSPEGVTILAAAVVDDILGIIILAVVLGMADSGHVGWRQISFISIRAVGMWLVFTLLGLKYAQKISEGLKKVQNPAIFSVLSLGLALLVAGIFERSGLALIIGSYVMGLSLSKTDLSFIVQERLEVLQHFFVPIFFCVMGMLINVQEMMAPEVLFFGLIYVVFAIVGKIVGCAIPSLFLNFNMRGAMRIGVGMVPRGEVALIIAGIGLSSGLISDKVFSVAMIMTFVTTLITPPILDKMLADDGPTVRKADDTPKESQSVSFKMPNLETAELVLNKVVLAYEQEGFYVHRMSTQRRLYQIRKEDTFIALHYTSKHLLFECMPQDVGFVNTLFYEVIAELERVMQNLQTLSDKSEIGKNIFSNMETIVNKKRKRHFEIVSSNALTVKLKSQSKEGILGELIGLLVASGQLPQDKKNEVVQDLLEREAIMSTGMQDGIALPHAKTNAVSRVVIAVGISKEGVDFDSLDQKKSQIFVCTLASKDSPHAYLQSMSEISRFLAQEENREKLLSCNTTMQLYDVLDFTKG